MRDLGLSYVSRHAWGDNAGKLRGRSAGKHRHAAIGRKLHLLVVGDRDLQRVDAGRREYERSSLDVAHLSAANDRFRGVRADTDDRGEDRDGKKQWKNAHPCVESKACAYPRDEASRITSCWDRVPAARRSL